MAASDSNAPQCRLQLSNQPPSQNQTPTPVQHEVRAHQPASSASASVSSSKRFLTHKSWLEGYTHGAGISPPVYQTGNEGRRRGPAEFRSAVLVGGVCYTSPNTFTGQHAAEQDAARLAVINITEKIQDEGKRNPPPVSTPPNTFPGQKAAEQDAGRLAMISIPEKMQDERKRNPPPVSSPPNAFPGQKAAEQDAARLAMISITEKIKDENLPIPPIHEDLLFCKSILNDYIVKRKMETPTYRTFLGSGKVPFFISSLVFNGVSITGDVAKSKKEAERLAARAVVQSLLGDSESAPIMLEILRSRNKLALRSKELDSSHASLATSAVNTGQSYVISTDTPIAAAPEASLGMHPPRREFIKRKQEEPASQATPQLPMTFVPSGCEQPVGVVSTSLATASTSLAAAPTSLARGSTSLAAAPTSLTPASTSLGVSPTFCGVLRASRKRRKNMKAETNLQNDAQLPVGTLNLNQAASCSVSQ